MEVKKKNNEDESSSMRGFLPGILVGVLLSIGYNYIFEAPPEIASAKIEEIVNSPEVKKVKYDFYQLLKENEILISDDELSGPEKSNTGSYLLQVGSFRGVNDAENRKVELLLLNLPTKVEKITVESGDVWHRVLVGPYLNTSKMASARAKLAQNDFSNYVVKLKQ